MIRIVKALLFSAVIFISLSLEAQTDKALFSADSTLSAPSASIGETIILTLKLTYPEGYSPDSDKLKERLISFNGYGEPPFKITGLTEEAESAGEGKLSRQLTILLQAQKAGKFILGPKVVNFTGEKSKEAAVALPIKLYEVEISEIPPSPPSEAMIAPFIDLVARLPVTLSYENRKRLLRTEAEIAEEGKSTAAELASKAFPWSALIAFFSVGLVSVLIWILPEERIGEEKDKVDLEEQNEKIRNALRRLALFTPQSKDNIKTYFKEVEHSIKELLDAEYSIHAFTSTSAELSKRIEQMPELPQHLKYLFTEVFETSDRIKFAKQLPAANDIASASEAAKAAADQIAHRNTAR